jgi:hypothetical protein
MDNTLTAGQLVQIIDNLESPHGLSLSSAPDKIIVADSHTVKEIDINNKLVTVVAKGFGVFFGITSILFIQGICQNLARIFGAQIKASTKNEI